MVETTKEKELKIKHELIAINSQNSYDNLFDAQYDEHIHHFYILLLTVINKIKALDDLPNENDRYFFKSILYERMYSGLLSYKRYREYKNTDVYDDVKNMLKEIVDHYRIEEEVNEWK